MISFGSVALISLLSIPASRFGSLAMGTDIGETRELTQRNKENVDVFLKNLNKICPFASYPEEMKGENKKKQEIKVSPPF